VFKNESWRQIQIPSVSHSHKEERMCPLKSTQLRTRDGGFLNSRINTTKVIPGGFYPRTALPLIRSIQSPNQAKQDWCTCGSKIKM